MREWRENAHNIVLLFHVRRLRQTHHLRHPHRMGHHESHPMAGVCAAHAGCALLFRAGLHSPAASFHRRTDCFSGIKDIRKFMIGMSQNHSSPLAEDVKICFIGKGAISAGVRGLNKDAGIHKPVYGAGGRVEGDA